MKRSLISVLLLWAAILLLPLTCPFSVSAEVTDSQWHDLMAVVGTEHWKEAFSLSSKFLKELKADDERLPRLRYVYLYSAAGKVSEGQMSYSELEKIVKEMIGKDVVLPYRQIKQKDRRGSLNFISFPDDAEKKAFVSATNKSGTTVLAFEYTTLKEDFDPAGHEGEYASISGVIDDIKPNPNKSNLIILRLYISNGQIKLKE
jgi:hypothetical protein